MMRIVMFLVLALLPVVAQADNPPPAAGPNAARYGQWRSSHIGGGGYVMNVLATNDPQVFYTYIDNSGLYRSDDGGHSWRMLHGTLPAIRGAYNVRGLLVDPRDNKKLILATGTRWDPSAGIYLSDDAGQTWRPSAVTTMRFDGADPLRHAGQILARQPNQPDVVLAASFGTGLWRSTDNGEHWEKRGLEEVRPTGLLFDQHDPQRVWLCAREVKEKYLGKAHDFTGGLYVSSDAGVSWQKLAEDSPQEIVQDPKQPDRLYGIFQSAHIRISEDAGKTWRPFEEGLTINPKKAHSTSGFSYRALGAGPDFILLGAGNGTVYRLASGESQWKKIDREEVDVGNWYHGTKASGWAMSSLTVDPRNPNHWFFTDYFAIYQTLDAGKHWKLTIDGMELTVVHQVLADPTDPGRVYMVQADNCFFTSLDGGNSFVHYNTRPGKYRANRIQSMTVSAKDIDLSLKRPNRLYVVGARYASQFMNQVYISDDRGDTWRKSPMTGINPNQACNSISVDPEHPDTVYVAASGAVTADGGGGVYRSRDGGDSWQWLGKGLPQVKYFFFIDPWNQGKEVAVGPGSKLVCISKYTPGIWHFDDKTQSWSKADVALPAGAQPYCVSADMLKPGRFFVGVRHAGIYRTEDAGMTWSKVYGSSASYIATDRVTPNRVAASTEDGVILSRDGGDTWEKLDQHLPDRVIRNAPTFAGDRLIVTSPGSGVFWIPLSPQGEKPLLAKDLAQQAAR